MRRSLASCCRYTNSTNFSTSAEESPFLGDSTTLALTPGESPWILLDFFWPLGGSPESLGLLCDPRGLKTALRVRVAQQSSREETTCMR